MFKNVEICTQLNIKVNKKYAKQRQKIISKNEMKIILDLFAFIAYVEGGDINQISQVFNIKYSTLKYKISKIRKHGIKGLLDMRYKNGFNQKNKITDDLSQRILELKILQTNISSREISKILYNQDKTKISHTLINIYLNKVGLKNYKGSDFLKIMDKNKFYK